MTRPHLGKHTSSVGFPQHKISASMILLIFNQNKPQKAPNWLCKKVILDHAVMHVRKSSMPLAYYSKSNKNCSHNRTKMTPFSCVWFDSLDFWERFPWFWLNPCFKTHTQRQFSILKSGLPKIGTGKGRLTSLIATLLLVEFINYDIVTWGLADRLHHFSSVWL